MRRTDYRHLVGLRRPPAHVNVPVVPVVTGEIVPATCPTTPRLGTIAELRAALDGATADLPVVSLGDYGRHYPHTVVPVPSDWSPLHPADRQAIAPTFYADRHLPAGDPTERTGLLDLTAITTALGETR